MSVIADIPERDGKDGAAQLVTLRAYLKDRGSEKVYPETLLVDLLVHETSLEVWRAFVGVGLTGVPFTYTPLDMSNYITRVRMLTSDTVEDTLDYTDVDILNYLEFLPLRYLVACINAKKKDIVTFPKDSNNPLHILRKYLEDEGGEKWTDGDLVEILFSNRMNPFGIVLNLMERAASANTAISALNSGQSLASIDGITFGAPMEETALEKKGRDTVSEHAARSVYEKESAFGFYEDDINIAKIEWEVKWYAIH